MYNFLFTKSCPQMRCLRNFGALFVILFVAFAPKIEAAELCQWIARSTLQLYELKSQNGFSQSSLDSLAAGMVEKDREENYFKKIKIKSLLMEFIELFYDTEFNLEGFNFSEAQFEELFNNACEESW